MTSKAFVHSFFSTYIWGNILAIGILVTILSIGVRYGIDYYTHVGESIVVPDVIHKQYDDALDIMDKVGLTMEVADTGYVKDLPPDCILEQTPAGGKRVKSTRVIYVTINAASTPTLPLPDLADNSSLREAQALLLSMGFKVGDPEYVPGEKDWVYGVLVNGKPVQAGDRVPIDALIVLQVGDGTRDANDTTSQRPAFEYEDVEVEEPKYEEYYDWVEVPVDENGNEIKTKDGNAPRTVPSVPPQSPALPPDPHSPKPTD
ncbi:PASTA domain-containing protein [Prevotella aurantiaca]|jgi:PASTA domain protein|uniref:PASTA domain-containing protein n=1 Tax=Prevotella aurantiaca TaxID=596085 RepID=UPI00235391B4|nr:PASTA domain-containing protein [Prevotella aurantiaca]